MLIVVSIISSETWHFNLLPCLSLFIDTISQCGRCQDIIKPVGRGDPVHTNTTSTTPMILDGWMDKCCYYINVQHQWSWSLILELFWLKSNIIMKWLWPYALFFASIYYLLILVDWDLHHTQIMTDDNIGKYLQFSELCKVKSEIK